MDFSTLGALLAFVSYTIATLAIVIRLFHPQGPNIIFVLAFGCLGIIFHTIVTSQHLLTDGTINFALPNVISVVNLVITLTVSAIALKYKVNLLLPVTYGFAGIWQLFTIFIPHDQLTPLSIERFAVFSHITMALVAYCILIIATLYAFQVAYINMKLKNKNLMAVSHLPPLMLVEKQLFMVLATGTLCLLLSQLIGITFMDNFISKSTAHKSVFSFMALAIYLVILWGHFKQGWRGHKVLTLTIVASTFLTLAYFGSRFVKEFLLY